jgi:hypothetical protein
MDILLVLGVVGFFFLVGFGLIAGGLALMVWGIQRARGLND